MKTIVQLATELKTYFLGKDTAAKQAVEANIAPVETDASAASQGYSAGAQLILNDVLYDVIAPINANDALVVGTNIQAADDLSTKFSSLNSALSIKTTPLTATLAQGATSVTIQDARITTSSTFLPVSETFGLAPTAISVTTGQIVMTYDAQAQAENVGVLVY